MSFGVFVRVRVRVRVGLYLCPCLCILPFFPLFILTLTLTSPLPLALEFVRGFVEVYNVLGVGSAFFHASSTSVGGAIDTKPIDFFALMFVQGTLSSIPFNPILHEIRMPTDAPLQYTSTGFVDAMTEMISEKSVYEWEDILNSFNAPDAYLSFGAFFSLCIDVVFLDQPDVAIQLVTTIGSLILTPEKVTFITEQYMPEFRREVTSKIPFSGEDRAKLTNQFVGTLMKMIFAIYWQEQIINQDHLDDAEAIARGAECMPAWNALANAITGFVHVDMDVQQSINVYPGDAKCRAQQPHSIWHEQSGNGLVDLALVSQFADSFLRNPRDDGKTVELGLLGCLVENDCLDGGIVDGDFGSIIICVQMIPFVNPNPPCGDKINVVGLLECTAECAESDRCCLVSCFVDNGEIGATVVDRAATKRTSDSRDSGVESQLLFVTFGVPIASLLLAAVFVHKYKREWISFGAPRSIQI